MDYMWLTKAKVHTPKHEDNTNDEAWKSFVSSPAYKVFVLGFSPPRLEILGSKLYRDTDYNLTYDLSLFDRVVVASQYGSIGTSWEDFHCGSDSGYAGLQLAVILGYKHIFLIGFDFNVKPHRTHYRNDCSREDAKYYKTTKLDVFVKPYRQAMLDILSKTKAAVYICSPTSQLRACQPYIPYKEALRQCKP
jgi:hypothetical protein